nr:tRNA pseudouridine(38-40) synthase TruA [Parvularcula maris]
MEVEYDGGPFAGWQRQENAPSVQATIEDAALVLAPGEAHCYGAGRTDAGVHALGMTAHLDMQREIDPFKLQGALNGIMRPAPVSVLSAELTDKDFHARFSCTERRYLYRIVCRRAPLALDEGRAWRVTQELDAEAMAEAAKLLEGTHDFTTFRSAHCQSKSPVKSITEIRAQRRGEAIDLHLRAPSFLHNQVRSIAGSLERVGIGRWSVGDFRGALKAKDRTRCGPVAPAHGLYFVEAVYS